jgi:hypothetical protein
MQKLQFKVTINALVGKVYDIMLGISNKATYEAWTALFNPTSTYEGSWKKGSKMLFIGTDENGNKGGMVSEVFDCTNNRFVSIRHYGILKNNEEITTGPEVEKWANGYENYSFEESNGITTVTVDIDVTKDFLDYMNQTFPKALEKLKEICEK